MYRVKSGNKYHAERQFYNGVQYDSKAEAGYAAELDLRLKAGDIKGWTPHVQIPLTVSGKHICNYEIDFVVNHNDGHLEFVEVKGMVLPLWRQKWRIFEATYKDTWPDADLTVVKISQMGRRRWGASDVKKAKARVIGTKAA